MIERTRERERMKWIARQKGTKINHNKYRKRQTHNDDVNERVCVWIKLRWNAYEEKQNETREREREREKEKNDMKHWKITY